LEQVLELQVEMGDLFRDSTILEGPQMLKLRVTLQLQDQRMAKQQSALVSWIILVAVIITILLEQSQRGQSLESSLVFAATLATQQHRYLLLAALPLELPWVALPPSEAAGCFHSEIRTLAGQQRRLSSDSARRRRQRRCHLL
jgi:hypothetical protein